MTGDSSRESELAASWDANAASWTSVVRRGGIPSRRAGTDDAILRACESVLEGRASRRVLDVGCGEGWLARALAERGSSVLGVDGSSALIERAREAGGGPSFQAADYARLTSDPTVAAGPWDLVVCNFALLGEDIHALLASLGSRLGPGGVLLVHTIHPWSHAAVDPPYADGWRRETWDRFDGEFTTPMPWYFRTLASWLRLFGGAGLGVHAIDEPRDAESGALLSLLFHCRRTTTNR